MGGAFGPPGYRQTVMGGAFGPPGYRQTGDHLHKRGGSMLVFISKGKSIYKH